MTPTFVSHCLALEVSAEIIVVLLFPQSSPTLSSVESKLSLRLGKLKSLDPLQNII